jgi:hypothetical protein
MKMKFLLPSLAFALAAVLAIACKVRMSVSEESAAAANTFVTRFCISNYSGGQSIGLDCSDGSDSLTLPAAQQSTNQRANFARLVRLVETTYGVLMVSCDKYVEYGGTHC